MYTICESFTCRWLRCNMEERNVHTITLPGLQMSSAFTEERNIMEMIVEETLYWVGREESFDKCTTGVH